MIFGLTVLLWSMLLVSLWTVMLFANFFYHSSPPSNFLLYGLQEVLFTTKCLLVPALTSLNIHCVEQGDRQQDCVRRPSVKDLGCVTLLSYLYFITVLEEVSRYSCCFLAPCEWIIESLLFNCIGHHLTCVSIIRRTSTHTEHLKHM